MSECSRVHPGSVRPILSSDSCPIAKCVRSFRRSSLGQNMDLMVTFPCYSTRYHRFKPRRKPLLLFGMSDTGMIMCCTAVATMTLLRTPKVHSSGFKSAGIAIPIRFISNQPATTHLRCGNRGVSCAANRREPSIMTEVP